MASSMDIFSSSANPKSFKMHRRSRLATKLKATVAKKLIQFLDDNYTDDVLAEYIVVLVCNGKHQNQAKSELEAFLGDKSGEFVSWLWDILSKIVHQSHMPKDAIRRSACGDAVVNDLRISRLGDLQNHAVEGTDILLSKEEKSYLSTSAHMPVSSMSNEVYDPCQQFRPEFDSSMDVKNAKRLRLEKFGSEGSRKSGSAEVIRNATVKHGSSRVKGSSEILAEGDQIMRYVDQRKFDHSNRNELPHQLLQSPKGELVSRRLPSLGKENPQRRPIPVAKFDGTRLSTNSASQRNARPRGNVWDRLGKPCEDNTIMRRSRIEVPSVDDIIRKTLAQNEGPVQRKLRPCVPVGNRIRWPTGEVPSHDNSMDTVIPDTNRNEFKQLHGLSAMRSPHEEKYSSRKRQFGEIDPGDANCSDSLADNNYKPFELRETLEVNTTSSIQCSGSQGLNNVAAESRKSDVTGTSCAFRSPDIPPNLKDKNVSQSKLIRVASELTPQVLVSDNSPSVTMLESINNEKGVHTSLKPVNSEMLDPKLRLLQNELEMSKLFSKNIEMSDGDQVDSLSSSGTLSLPEEDNKSRTVFVTNVHFGATKEAISSHFTKCGLVVKVIMLTDPLTGRPKGSAYITFASKESVDKAVKLSGSSFWSRILTVLRKSEMPAAEPAQLAQSWFPQSNRKTIFQRSYSSSHLQWHRDQQVNTNNSISTQGSVGLEASQTAEQDDAIDFDAQVLPRSLTYVRTTEAAST